MTRDEAMVALDGACADIVRAYRDLGSVAALVRTDAGFVRVVTLPSEPGAIATLLYAAADTFSDRALEAKASQGRSSHTRH